MNEREILGLVGLIAKREILGLVGLTAKRNWTMKHLF